MRWRRPVYSCPKCGSETKEDWYFCPACGESLQTGRKDEFYVSSNDLVQKVEELSSEENVRRIIVKDEAGMILTVIPVARTLMMDLRRGRIGIAHQYPFQRQFELVRLAETSTPGTHYIIVVERMEDED